MSDRFVFSGSSIADWQQCPLRWAYKWVDNRTPRRIPTALRTGTAVHAAFERHFTDGAPLDSALHAIIEEAAGNLLLDADEAKALDELRELVVPLSHWRDAYPIEETLEVETPFEMEIGEGLVFQGRPDRVGRMGNHVFHMQHKTVGKSQNLGLFIDTARNSLHELIYGWHLERKYCGKDSGLVYSGTLFNMVRKLQYRSKAKGKEGKPLHEPHEFFMQSLIGIDPRVQEKALYELPVLGRQMRHTARVYLGGGVVPPNRRMDRGPYGNSLDPYFRVIMGEASLEDDMLFMPRQDPYSKEDESE